MRIAFSLVVASCSIGCSVPEVIVDAQDAASEGGDAPADATGDSADSSAACGASKCCGNVACYGPCTGSDCAKCGTCEGGTVCCSAGSQPTCQLAPCH